MESIIEILKITNTTLWIYICVTLFILIMWIYAMYSTIRIKNMMKDIYKLLEMQTLLINKLDDKLKNIDDKIKINN